MNNLEWNWIEQRFIQRIQRHIDGAESMLNNAKEYLSKRQQILHIVGESSPENLAPENFTEYRGLGEYYEFAKDMYKYHVTSILKLITRYYKGNLLVCAFVGNPQRFLNHITKISEPFNAFNAMDFFPVI